MEYKDQNGKTLYGYSQENLSELITEQKRNNALLGVLIGILFLFFLVLGYVVFRIENGNIVANIVSRCIC